MIICGFDLETSGLAIGSSKIVEIACALYCTKRRRIFEMWSSLVWDSRYPPMFDTDEAFKVNGHRVEDLKALGIMPTQALEEVRRYFNKASATMAHNGVNFDLPFLQFEATTYNIPIPERVCIDSRTDFEYPSHMTSRRLTHLSVDHGLVLDPEEAHGALYDVINMFKVAKNYDVDAAFERAKSPMIRIYGKPPMERNQEAKTNRYRWDREKKVWYKDIRSCDFEKEKALVSFALRSE